MANGREAEYELAKLLLDQNWRDHLINDAAYMWSLRTIGYEEHVVRGALIRLKMERDIVVTIERSFRPSVE